MGAAGLPFLIGRLQRNHKITPGPPIRRRTGVADTDSILHDPRVLRFVVEMMGADRVMMGSDMPFPIGEEDPAQIVSAAGLTGPGRVDQGGAGRKAVSAAVSDGRVARPDAAWPLCGLPRARASYHLTKY